MHWKESYFTMLRRLTFAAMLVLVTQSAALAAGPGQAERQPVFPFPIEKTTLENGLTVISVPFDSPGIIAYYTVVRTGSRNEVEKGLSGFAHFFEHMMFRGTEKYPQDKYNDVLKALGADSNAFTTDDWTCYHMTIPVIGPGHGRRHRVRPVPEPQVRRTVVPERSPGRARRVQQECFLTVPEAARGHAEHGLHQAYLQAYDDRVPGRHQGYAQSVCLQQDLL